MSLHIWPILSYFYLEILYPNTEGTVVSALSGFDSSDVLRNLMEACYTKSEGCELLRSVNTSNFHKPEIDSVKKHKAILARKIVFKK